jgi:hypothetical protein
LKLTGAFHILTLIFAGRAINHSSPFAASNRESEGKISRICVSYASSIKRFKELELRPTYLSDDPVKAGFIFVKKLSGKFKSATTVLKETPGFYVCLRNPDRDKDLLLVPKANLITNALQNIFYGSYIEDGLEDQSEFSCNSSTVGKCLVFVAQSIKSYIIEVGKNLAMKLDGEEDGDTLELKLLSTIKEFSSNNFEASNTNFELFSSDSMTFF